MRVEDALAHIDTYAEYFRTLLDVKRKSGRSLSDIGNYTRFHTKMMTSEPAFACDLRWYDKLNELEPFLFFLQKKSGEQFWDIECGWDIFAAHNAGRVVIREGDLSDYNGRSDTVSLFSVSFEEAASVAAEVLSDGRAFAAAMKAAVGTDYWSDYGRGEPDDWEIMAKSYVMHPPPS